MRAHRSGADALPRAVSRDFATLPARQARQYGVELRDRILAQLELPPPAGMASWDGGSFARALSVSDDAVWRILRKECIQLQRHRSWCVSTDPEFAAKAADVIVNLGN